MVNRLPLETQTIYAELIDRLQIHEAHRSIGSVPGSFTTKTVKGRTYLYFRYSDPGSSVREIYLGALNRDLQSFEERYRQALSDEAEEQSSIGRLAALLRAGGAITTDAASARLVRAFGDAGVFSLGGMLVGTHAFIALGNLLGIRWSGSSLRTMDVDGAAARTLDVAVPNLPADVPGTLESLEMGFLPVPKLNPIEPSTSFKVRGQGLRVDLLTTAAPRQVRPHVIHRLSAAAQPLKYLDYLLERPVEAAVIDGGATLVNVPDPARFALHKLVVSSERPAVEQAKREKDLFQAAQVLEVLAEDRPGDLELAVEAMLPRGRSWRRALSKGLTALRDVDPDLALHLRRLLQTESYT